MSITNDERTPLSLQGNIYRSINQSDDENHRPISSLNELLSHCSKCLIVVYYAAILILLIGLLIVVFFGSFISLTDEKIMPWSSKSGNSSSTAFCSNFTCGVSPTNCRGVSPTNCPKSSLLKIIGGQAAESCSWPWRAALYETSDNARTLVFLCGASILAPNWLLTAAHCLKNHSRSVRRFRSLLSRSEELEDDDGDGLYGISEIRVHPSFDKDTMYYDLALLKLSRPISCQLRSPICLPSDSQDLPKAGSKVTIIGWGVTSRE
uniref:Peptidase S1 domain-containing protein n=1 Tax=Romanomermis culicivorax TaxID=13658 RepID=A0A915I4K7_ROMCU